MDNKNSVVERIREFSRFYTALMGGLDSRYLGSEYSLTETRVMFELLSKSSASDIIEKLRIDKSYMSRIIKSFEARGLIVKTVSERDRRINIISLTDKGRAAIEELSARANAQIGGMISDLDEKERAQLCGAMDLITYCLSPKEREKRNIIMELKQAEMKDIQIAVDIINTAKEHLKQQGIDQWQNGYPDYDCIKRDILNGKGYFIAEGDNILGYLCVDFDGEPAYSGLNGQWNTNEKYVVVHRMAFSEKARGRGLSGDALSLVEEMSKKNGVYSFRVDTDADNKKMRHILSKNGFEYCGTIWFDNSEKIAFDKKII